MTREEWLIKLNTDYVLPYLHSQKGGGGEFPWRVSIGFPGGGSARKRVGECWAASNSADNVFEIFISPVVSSPADMAHILLHEDIHAQVGLQHGHKGPFKQLAKACGLTGKMTATVPGPELAALISQWLSEMPAFPGAQLTLSERGKKGSRLIKAVCETCGYTVRVTRKWVDVGIPTCPNLNCLGECMVVDLPADTDSTDPE